MMPGHCDHAGRIIINLTEFLYKAGQGIAKRSAQDFMEQLYLFAPEEMIRNNAMKALINGEFYRSGKHWMELKNLNSGNDFVNVALDISHYWMEGYGDDEEFKQEKPLEVYKKWLAFEQYIDTKAYRKNAVIRDHKGKYISLEHRSGKSYSIIAPIL
ncbi:MAG: hypothetical protein NT178_01700 [Proteobacteria bacterium]|nr:hypothetical protein [Pseudomonadota bacterium]